MIKILIASLKKIFSNNEGDEKCFFSWFRECTHCHFSSHRKINNLFGVKFVKMKHLGAILKSTIVQLDFFNQVFFGIEYLKINNFWHEKLKIVLISAKFLLILQCICYASKIGIFSHSAVWRLKLTHLSIYFSFLLQTQQAQVRFFL